jgi:hypothetical protein
MDESYILKFDLHTLCLFEHLVDVSDIWSMFRTFGRCFGHFVDISDIWSKDGSDISADVENVEENRNFMTRTTARTKVFFS